ncbi:conserved hypothetical protein [Citricoccus sp. K5]|nr:conserved hypothetical protein [Citricoccus sp. K5]
MCSTGGHTLTGVRGSPIRKSWNQRPVIDSSRLIADSHVLHRLLLPRHPPCALKNLATQGQALNEQHPPPTTHQKQGSTTGVSKDDYILGATTHHQGAICGSNKNKMLASTMQFPNNNPHHTSHTNDSTSMLQHGRNQTTGPEQPPPHHTTTQPQKRPSDHVLHEQPVLLSQDPTVCQHPNPSTQQSFHTTARHPGQHPRRPFQTQYYDHQPVRPGHYSLMFHP